MAQGRNMKKNHNFSFSPAHYVTKLIGFKVRTQFFPLMHVATKTVIVYIKLCFRHPMSVIVYCVWVAFMVLDTEERLNLEVPVG